MSVTSELRDGAADLWQRAVRHPFILELGSGALSMERFRRYFVQDYLFVNDLSRVSGLAIARAPDLDAARAVDGFLGTILGAEDALFLRAFGKLGMPEAEYRSAALLPTTAAFGNYLVRLAYEGSFTEICCALYVTEGVYLDWANRLRADGARPGVEAYQEWINIHTEEALGPFVAFLRDVVDAAAHTEIERLRPVFNMALRYEVAFWEMAYHGETWP